jgi:hypothetical protein
MSGAGHGSTAHEAVMVAAGLIAVAVVLPRMLLRRC